MVDLFSGASSAEILFVGLYFVGFIGPLAMIIWLSFLAGEEWGPDTEYIRIWILRMGRQNDDSPWGLMSLIVLGLLGTGLYDLGWSYAATEVVLTIFVFSLWIVFWDLMFPEERICTLLDRYKFNRDYRQLKEVADGFGR